MAVRRAVEMGVARRTLSGLAKTMRDQVAAGTASFTQAQEKVAALEKRAATDTVAVPGRRGNLRMTLDEQAFGSFISPRPWERARWGPATPP